MKPTFQTRFGSKDGNCMAACIASILELPLERVDFVATDEEWLPRLRALIEPMGLGWVEITLGDKYQLCHQYGQICVFSGRSPRGECNHAVVGRIHGTHEEAEARFETIHDPMPGGTGLGGPIKFIGFFTPIDPASMRKSFPMEQ